jgi:hypothetical protein
MAARWHIAVITLGVEFKFKIQISALKVQLHAWHQDFTFPPNQVSVRGSRTKGNGRGPMQTHAAAPKLEQSLSFRMKEVYQERQAGTELDAEYGDNVGGPPKNRRAGSSNFPSARLRK